ncbi:serine/threonine protein kinase [Salinigranum halophilum]|uniref:serine/threonine protein kinase n=1 Tax=Salinigranum halophilum TaxID=2565931 RepID=UPI0013756101|nr:serine/threonine-protein kinase [Salinigranum halophilum]
MQIPSRADLSAVRSPPRRSLSYREIKLGETIGRGEQTIVRTGTISGETDSDLIAVKEYESEGTLSRDAVEEFLRRATIWATVDARERQKAQWNDYEHVVGVIKVGDTLPWVAMEYMDAGSLDERLENRSSGLPLAEAVWIGQCICRGLEVAHEDGTAHLDLSPGNILFRETPDRVYDVPKIADWGLSREFSEQTGTVDGLSPQYAAPEQFISDEFGAPDTFTDVFQAGCLLYALLTGEPPYTGTALSVKQQVCDGERPPPPSELRSTVPQVLDEIVLKALATSKGDRYRTIASFESRLATCVEDGVASESNLSSTETKESEKTTGSESSTSDTRESEGPTTALRPSTSGRDISPAKAQEWTNLFVRYRNKDRPTLADARAGNADQESVIENLRLEPHTTFDNETATVEDDSYETYLRDTIEWGFAKWIVEDLLYEIGRSGDRSKLSGLFDAIHKINRIQFNGEVPVTIADENGKTYEDRPFDLVFWNSMGDPLFVANFETGRSFTTGEAVEHFIKDSRAVGESKETFGAAFYVTSSFFEPKALDAVGEETTTSLFSLNRKKSFVKLSRKRGYHLCLVEERNEEFHLSVPELM